MLRKCFALMAWAAIVGSGSAFGQSYGTDLGGGCGGGCGGGSTNCGREISQSDAAALWDNYCHETCHDFKRNRSCGLSSGCGAGGCFGYGNAGVAGGCNSCSSAGSPGPVGLGGQGRLCGNGGHFGHGGRLASRLHGASCGCEGCSSGGASCFGYPGGGFGNCGGCGNSGFGGFALGRNVGHGCGQHGCGLLGGGRSAGCGCGHHDGRIFRFLTGGNRPGLFSHSAANCGTNGAYFSEQVGPEYGTSGLLSNVAGCGTDFAPGSGVDTGYKAAIPATNTLPPASANAGDPGLMLAPQQ